MSDDDMPGSDELWRRKIMAAEEDYEVPVRRTRNDMKRIREDMEEDLENMGYDVTTYKSHQNDVDHFENTKESEGGDHGTRGYMAEDGTVTHAKKGVVDRIQVSTLNIGSYKKIMWQDGTPKASFLMLVMTRQREACVMFLQEVHLTHKNEVWLKFKVHMSNIVPWMKISYLVGPAGTCLMYSKSLQHVAEAMIDKTQNTVRLEMRRTNTKDCAARTIFYGVYFPFGRDKVGEIKPTLDNMVTVTTTIAQNAVYAAGDFNADRYNKKKYSEKLAQAHLKRVQTPTPTGIPQRIRLQDRDGEASEELGGGRAQAIWTNVPDTVQDVEVLTMYDDLSNHHRPVVFTVPLFTSAAQRKDLHVFTEMKKVRPRSFLAKEMNRATSWEHLLEIIDEGTVSLPKNTPYRARVEKGKINEQQTKAQKKKKRDAMRDKMYKTVARKERELFDACTKNGPLLKTALFRKDQPYLPDCEKPNETFAKALKTLSFCKKPVDTEEYFKGPTSLATLHTDIKAALYGEYTWEELIKSRPLLGHTKTYADYEARVAHIMCDVPLKIVAKKFEEWSRIELQDEWEMMYSKLIGIPTNKPHSETEIMKMMQKMRRPIGILPLFRAWFYCTLAIRMKKLVRASAPPNMHGSIPGREGHEMCLRLLVLAQACENRPLWVFQMDLVKYFDALQHEVIKILDEVLQLPKPFFEVLSKQFEMVVHRVRVVQGEEATLQQESGGTQGTSTVPALAALVLVPFAQKLNEYSCESQRRECPGAPPGMRSVDMFVDDMTVTSEASREGISRVIWAKSLLKLIGVDAKIVAVACNDAAMQIHKLDYDPDYEPDYDYRFVTIDDQDYPIQGAVRILGTCIHLAKGSKCALTKCKRCNVQNPTKWCTECEQEVLFNVRALPIKQVDKVECMNQRVLSSIMYGTYSCPVQRKAMVNVEDNVRKTLFGYGAGGYVVAAHLPAKKMGLGLRDTKRFLAIETAAIIERSLTRKEMIPRVQDMLKRTGAWPVGIASALDGHDGENMIEIRLHEDLVRSEKSQRERVQIKWKHERVGRTTHITALLRSTKGEERTMQRMFCSDDDLLATARCLAEIIETTKNNGADVVFEEPLPELFEAKVRPFEDDFVTIGTPNRVFYSVIARTRVGKLMEARGESVYERVSPVYSEMVPAAYPMTIKLWGRSGVVTGSTRQDLTAALNDKQEEEFWEGNRQLKDVCKCLHMEELKIMFSLEKTCPIAGVRRGVYHVSEMPARRANLLMRVFTGTEFKTVELVDAKGGFRPPRAEDYCKAPGCTGKVLSLKHILDHVTMEKRAEAVQRVKNLGYKWKWTHEHPNLHCFLGLVHRGMTSYTPCREDEKEHTQFLKKAAAIFAELGLQAFETCTGRTSSSDDTPELEPLETHLTAKDFTFQGYADAATYSEGVKDREGKKVGSRHYLGLGGVVRSKDGVVAKFQVRVEVPRELFNSTVGEHLAHIVLIKVAKYNECRNTCFLCDNNSVPAHLDGDFSCNTVEINVIRRTTYSLMDDTGARRGWLPRLKNVESDGLAKEAAKGLHDPSKYPEEYFREMRTALEEAIKAVRESLESVVEDQ